MKKIDILCLFGGKSTEHEVSLISAYSILKNINREKYNIYTVGITKTGDWFYYDGPIEKIRDGSWKDTSVQAAAVCPSVSDSSLIVFSGDKKSCRFIHIDVIFPIMHGANAEDGTLQGLVQISGIPLVGCKCAASAVGMDKVFTKMILANYNIPQAKSLVISARSIESDIETAMNKCEQLSGYPLFVKPANAGSSVGASKASSREELAASLKNSAVYDSKVIVEEYINGKECEVAVLGKGDFRVSTVGQIVPGSEFYDYETKYSESSPATYSVPAKISEESSKTIRALAEKICTALDVEGLSRVDFFVSEKDGREQVIFNEINTLPGFTEISMYPKLFIHDGISYPELIDRLVEIAMGRGEKA